MTKEEYVNRALSNGQKYVDRGTDATNRTIMSPRAYLRAVARDAGKRYDKGLR